MSDDPDRIDAPSIRSLIKQARDAGATVERVLVHPTVAATLPATIDGIPVEADDIVPTDQAVVGPRLVM